MLPGIGRFRHIVFSPGCWPIRLNLTELGSMLTEPVILNIATHEIRKATNQAMNMRSTTPLPFHAERPEHALTLILPVIAAINLLIQVMNKDIPELV
jgi:hypothetical protein